MLCSRLAKNFAKCVALTETQIRFGGHSCGNTGSAFALTSSFRASVDADKILSLSLFLSIVTLDGRFDKHKNKIVTRGKSISRGDKTRQRFTARKWFMTRNRSFSYETSHQPRHLCVNQLSDQFCVAWVKGQYVGLATASTKVIAMSILNVVLMNVCYKQLSSLYKRLQDYVASIWLLIISFCAV